MMSIRKVYITGVVFLTLFTILLSNVSLATSQVDIKLTTPFPRIEVGSGQEIQLDINVNNLGTGFETLDLVVSELEGWDVSLKSGSYITRSVSLAPGENRLVELTASPPLTVSVGSYAIEIKALRMGKLVDYLSVVIDIAELSSLGILLSTPSPSIAGPDGEEFQFTVEVQNETGGNTDILLSAMGPPNWIITFSERYQETLIRAINLDDGEKKTLNVTISPPQDIEADKYLTVVVASSGLYEESLGLGTTITGSYSMGLTTSDGVLSLNSTQGESTALTLLVVNQGTATLEGITFSSSKGSGWEVIFEPNEISTIPPGDSREVSVGIKPAGDAIPGDYSVVLRVNAQPPASLERLDLRVTVLGSAVWAIVGIFIIVLVIAGIFVIFWRLGRR